MRISAVVPTFNAAAFIVEAVESVLSQTWPPDEVIVVDDGSTDDTEARLTPFGAAVRYLYKSNGGVSSARNLGVHAAKGDLIAFLDADDVWHRRKLELQVAAIARRPDLALLGAELYDWPGLHPDLSESAESAKVVEIPFEQMAVQNRLVTSTLLVRAEALRTAGEFDLSLRGPEDHDMWLRIAQRGKVANLAAPLVGYRTVAGSLSKHAAQMEAGMRAILGKLDAAGAFDGRSLLRRRAWGYFHYSCGFMHHQAGNRWSALKHLALSFAQHPFGYSREEVRTPLGRLRLSAAAMMGGKGRSKKKSAPLEAAAGAS